MTQLATRQEGFLTVALVRDERANDLAEAIYLRLELLLDAMLEAESHDDSAD